MSEFKKLFERRNLVIPADEAFERCDSIFWKIILYMGTIERQDYNGSAKKRGIMYIVGQVHGSNPSMVKRTFNHFPHSLAIVNTRFSDYLLAKKIPVKEVKPILECVLQWYKNHPRADIKNDIDCFAKNLQAARNEPLLKRIFDGLESSLENLEIASIINFYRDSQKCKVTITALQNEIANIGVR